MDNRLSIAGAPPPARLSGALSDRTNHPNTHLQGLQEKGLQSRSAIVSLLIKNYQEKKKEKLRKQQKAPHIN